MPRLPKEEVDRRMALHKQGLSYKEIAEELHLEYTSIACWFKKQGVKPNTLQKNNGEYQRRYDAYMAHGSDKEAAESINMKRSCFNNWRRLHNLPAKSNQRVMKKDGSYVRERPQWERDLMRQFGSLLERANPKADVWEIVECYRDNYGCSVTNS